MSLSRKIVDAVDALPGAGEAVAEEGPHRLSLVVEAAGPVGLSFDKLTFSTESPSAWSAPELKGWGDRLAARVTYLLEPLVVLEADPVEVALRSKAPTPREGLRAFYELRLDRGGKATLGRFAFDEETRRRRPEPCRLTQEALARLADDLVATVS